jgi:hypothetical protein
MPLWSDRQEVKRFGRPYFGASAGIWARFSDSITMPIVSLQRPKAFYRFDLVISSKRKEASIPYTQLDSPSLRKRSGISAIHSGNVL